MIDYFTGAARTENKERCRKYFLKYDVNGDGVLQRAEVDEAIAGICKSFLMIPPGREKVDALVAKTDTNGDGVLSIDEWTRLYGLLVKSALAEASAVVEQQKAETAAASARAGKAAEERRASTADSGSKASTKGQGPKVKVKKPPRKAEGQQISGWTVDTRGEGCCFRFVCNSCEHTWFGMGFKMSTTMTCPGCGQTWPVTDHGWG